MACPSEPLLTAKRGHLLILRCFLVNVLADEAGGVVFVGRNQPISPGEGRGQCLGFNRPFLSPFGQGQVGLLSKIFQL